MCVCVCLQSDGAAGWKQALHSVQLVCGAVQCSTTSPVTSTAERRARLNSTRYHQTLQTTGQDVTVKADLNPFWFGASCVAEGEGALNTEASFLNWTIGSHVMGGFRFSWLCFVFSCSVYVVCPLCLPWFGQATICDSFPHDLLC